MLGRQQRLISRQAIPTARVKRVVEFSFDEARRMGHSYVGTEHLLLGLLIEGEGIAVQVLEGLGASRDEVRAEIERLLSRVSDETAPQDRQPSVPSASSTEPTQAPRPFSGLPPFERCSDRAKTALTLAREEAERSHRNYVGTEHLLLGLLREADGLAARVLGNLGIEIETVRMAIESIVGTDEHVVIQEIILTSRVKKVIEISFVEARRSRHRAIDTEHLLIGLLIEGEGIASRVLADRGVDLGRARGEIVRLAGEAR
ncbi:MAG: Clp protease N-terminal domain-containing protein [Candidatus Dormiibacterota bacterium]